MMNTALHKMQSWTPIAHLIPGLLRKGPRREPTYIQADKNTNHIMGAPMESQVSRLFQFLRSWTIVGLEMQLQKHFGESQTLGPASRQPASQSNHPPAGQQASNQPALMRVSNIARGAATRTKPVNILDHRWIMGRVMCYGNLEGPLMAS
jgi:hypothetical protein